ncbi:MAG: hypothetical protein EA339_10665 [Rhodobacteraceae bacterium]|nr:MAG: hypothetical protein EA339_10665 [Paracoccaceae bacterium]
MSRAGQGWLPVWLHLALIGAASLASLRLSAQVDALYRASGHPAGHMRGQLSFSAETMIQHFAVMHDAGTLDLYRQSQILDFALIACYAVLALVTGMLLARLGGPGSLGRRLGLAGAGLGLAGAAADLLENLTSLHMLAQPQEIATLTAIVYSSFAALKFLCLLIAGGVLIAALVVGLAERLAGAYRPR